MDSKLCRKCDTVKLRTEFVKNKYKHDGLTSVCSICREKRRKEYRQLNKEKFLAYESTPEYKARQKNKVYKTLYKITLDDYKKLLIEQNNCCKICKEHESILGKSLYVDHCHKTKKVRGLLCQKCNSGLGLFKDNLENLTTAIKYLKGELK